MSTTLHQDMQPSSLVPPCTEAGLPEPAPLTDQQMAQVAKGMAHPARTAILKLFADGVPRTTGEIVSASGLAQSTVSEHLRLLRNAELLSARRDGPRVWYCLRRSVLKAFSQGLVRIAETPTVYNGT